MARTSNAGWLSLNPAPPAIPAVSFLLFLDEASTLGDLAADIVILLAFLAFGVASWRLRLSYRVSVVAGLVLLVVTAIEVGIGQLKVGDVTAVFTLYFLAVGVSLAILEHVLTKLPRETTPRGRESLDAVFEMLLQRVFTRASMTIRYLFHRRSP